MGSGPDGHNEAASPPTRYDPDALERPPTPADPRCADGDEVTRVQRGGEGDAPPPPWPADTLTHTLGEQFRPCDFGKYRLLTQLGGGGMGVVYEAVACDGEGTTVALKLIRPDRTRTPSAVKRFLQEWKIVRRLFHPNIVPVKESGEVNGAHYFTMPHITGGTLQDFVTGEKGRLEPRQAALVVRELAEATRYAHENGVIHRDIKPQNILLDFSPPGPATPDAPGERLPFRAKLADFGLAKLVNEDSSLTLTQQNEILGTPAYMPPEQARGDLQAVCPASDVYSLGAVLHALLTGRPPFPTDGGTHHQGVALLPQVIAEEPRRPRELNPAVPAALDDIIWKCLRKAPAERYLSAGEFVAALSDYLDGRRLIRHTPRRPGWLRRMGQQALQSVRRNPVQAASTLVGLGLVLALAAGLGLVWPRYAVENARRAQAAAEQADLEQTRKQAHRELSAGEEQARVSRLPEAARNYTRAQESFARALKLMEAPHLAGAPGEQNALRLGLADAACKRALILRREAKTWEEAEKAYKDAQAALGQIPAQELEADQKRRKDNLLAETNFGTGLLNASRKADAHLFQAVGNYLNALEIRERLCKDAPGNREYLRDQARTLGHLGDVYLDLRDTDRARRAYQGASVLRGRIVQTTLAAYGEVGLSAEQRLSLANEARAAICQHARDHWNSAVLLDRTGEPRKARQAYLDGLREYDHPLFAESPTLPSECWLDRADMRTELAGLELGLPLEGQPALPRLELALAEYRRLKGDPGSDNTSGSDELREKICCARVIQGKALAQAGRTAEALEVLRTAQAGLSGPRGTRPQTLYLKAVLAAWLATLEPARQAEHRERAQLLLAESAGAGFLRHEWPTREPGFEGLRDSPGFIRAIARMKGQVES